MYLKALEANDKGKENKDQDQTTSAPPTVLANNKDSTPALFFFPFIQICLGYALLVYFHLECPVCKMLYTVTVSDFLYVIKMLLYYCVFLMSYHCHKLLIWRQKWLDKANYHTTKTKFGKDQRMPATGYISYPTLSNSKRIISGSECVFHADACVSPRVSLITHSHARVFSAQQRHVWMCYFACFCAFFQHFL